MTSSCQASAQKRPIRHLIGCGSWASLLHFSRRPVAEVDSPYQLAGPAGAYRWNHTKSLFALVARPLCKLLATVGTSVISQEISVIKELPQEPREKGIFFIVIQFMVPPFFLLFALLLKPLNRVHHQLEVKARVSLCRRNWPRLVLCRGLSD